MLSLFRRIRLQSFPLRNVIIARVAARKSNQQVEDYMPGWIIEPSNDVVEMFTAPVIYADGIAAIEQGNGIFRLHLFENQIIQGKPHKSVIAKIVLPSVSISDITKQLRECAVFSRPRIVR